MDQQVLDALRADRIIDITTTGRRSGEPSRKEMWFHNVDDVIYITGSPGRRDWYANMAAHPEFRFHLKQSTQADLDARAYPITATEEKRAILAKILDRLDRSGELDTWVAQSPLVRVEFLS